MKIFSSLHVSGERKYKNKYVDDMILVKAIVELEQLTGVAAILRFPMPELEEEDESETEE